MFKKLLIAAALFLPFTVSAATVGWNYFPANYVSPYPLSTTGIIVNASSTFTSTLNLASPLSIASGGTATTTQATNGVNYFDGTQITSTSTLFSFSAGSGSTGTLVLGGTNSGSGGVMRFNGGNPGLKAGDSIDGNISTTFGFDCDNVTSAICAFRLFRSTSSNNAQFVIDQPGVNNPQDQFNAAGITILNSFTGNVGIATTSPWGLLSIQGRAVGTTPLFVISSSTPTSTSTAFMVANSGHIYASSTVPTLSGCGTTPILNGDDTHGYVTVGATASGCTITFQIAYSAKPECTVTEETNSVVNIFNYVPSATNIVITQTGLAGNVVHYQCEGLIGSK